MANVIDRELQAVQLCRLADFNHPAAGNIILGIREPKAGRNYQAFRIQIFFQQD